MTLTENSDGFMLDLAFGIFPRFWLTSFSYRRQQPSSLSKLYRKVSPFIITNKIRVFNQPMSMYVFMVLIFDAERNFVCRKILRRYVSYSKKIFLFGQNISLGISGWPSGLWRLIKAPILSVNGVYVSSGWFTSGSLAHWCFTSGSLGLHGEAFTI